MCIFQQEHNGQGFIQRGGALGFYPAPSPPKFRPQTIFAHAQQTRGNMGEEKESGKSSGPSSGKGWNVGMVMVKNLISIVH